MWVVAPSDTGDLPAFPSTVTGHRRPSARGCPEEWRASREARLATGRSPGFNGGMIWAWRGLAALAALLVVLGVGVLAAGGPVSSAPSLEAQAPAEPEPAPSPSGGPADLPLPTGSVQPGDEPAEFVPVEERPVAVFLGDSITRGATLDPTWGDVTEWSWFYRHHLFGSQL